MSKRAFMELFYPESKIGGFTNIDGTIAFYFRVNALLDPSFVVVDFGCGRGEWLEDTISIRRELRNLKGKVKKVIGLDVSVVSGQQNSSLDEFRGLDGTPWPLEDDSVDLIIADWVLEHIELPDIFFCESRRVLKESGYLCLRTLNLMSYIGIFSKLIPNKFHAKVLNVAQNNRKEIDMFQTVYKCNTILKMRSLMSQYGFDHTVYGYDAEPSYLRFSKTAYWLGVLYQHFSPSFLKTAIFAFAQKLK